MPAECRVLVVEDSDLDWDALSSKVSGQTDIALTRAASFDEAIQTIGSAVFDAALIDADLGDASLGHKSPYHGLDVAKYFREHSPLTRRVLWTAHTLGARDILLKHLQPANDVFHYLLDKDTHPVYVANLRALKSQVQANWGLEIQTGEIEKEIAAKVSKADRLLMADSFLAFLRRLFYSPIQPDGSEQTEQVITRVSLETMSGGMSEALVVAVRVFAGEHECSMCVLKVASGQAIARERHAYTRFVRYMLRRNRRVELLDAIDNGRYGALLYSYAGAASKEIRNATRVWVESAGVSPLLEIVSGLFDPANREWYADEMLKEEHSLRTHLLNHYDITESVSEIEHVVRRVVAESQGRVTEQIVGANQEPQLCFGQKYFLPNPIPILRKVRYDIPFTSSIGHGDLHLGNLLSVDEQEWMLIDFERTGRIHCLQDFYSLEASVRQASSGWSAEATMEAEKWLLRATKKLVSDGAIVPSASQLGTDGQSREYSLILEIRRLSMANFIHHVTYDDWLKQYFLGLTVMLLFVLTRRSNPQQRRESMLIQAAYHFERLSTAFRRKQAALVRE